MQPLRFGRLWLAIGIVALLAGVLVATRPGGLMPRFTLADKVLHFAAFAAFTVWFGGLVRAERMTVVAVALLLYGLGIEVVQSFTPWRQADGQDLAADTAGILLGWGLASAGLCNWCRQLESWLVAPRRP